MFYTVSRQKRWFSPEVRYDQVDWTRLDSIVDAFACRISEWYIEPAEALKAASGHFAFASMALTCILIDTLSQFRAGAPASKGVIFKEFVRKRFPDFAAGLSEPIDHFDARKQRAVPMEDLADVLWHAFRCGIVHEAHVPPYGGLHGGDQVTSLHASGFTKYARDNADCPTVLVNPWLLLDQVKAELEAYVGELKTPAPRFDELRACFRSKFSDSFGVDITDAAA